MMEEFKDPQAGQEDQPGADAIKLREECADVRAGARQEDQLEGLHPGNDPDLKNNNNRLGCPPVSNVNNGDPKGHEYPKDEQRWPENKVPTK